jgi:hypothetical protein
VLSKDNSFNTVDADMIQITNLYSLLKIKQSSFKLRYLERVTSVVNFKENDTKQTDESITYTALIDKHYQLLSLIIKTVDTGIQNIFGNNLFNTQLATSGPNLRDDFITNAKAQNLTIISYTDCVHTLLSHYNNENDILVVKSEAKLLTEGNTLKNDIKVQYYGARSRKLLDSSQCEKEKRSIQIPVNLPAEERTKYNRFKGLGIDVYNSDDHAFTTRCYTFTDPDTQYDTTLNSRITNYFKNRTECLENDCTYKGMTLEWYVNCDCGDDLETTPVDPYYKSSNILNCIQHVSVVRLYVNLLAKLDIQCRYYSSYHTIYISSHCDCCVNLSKTQ